MQKSYWLTTLEGLREERVVPHAHVHPDHLSILIISVCLRVRVCVEGEPFHLSTLSCRPKRYTTRHVSLRTIAPCSTELLQDKQTISTAANQQQNTKVNWRKTRCTRVQWEGSIAVAVKKSKQKSSTTTLRHHRHEQFCQTMDTTKPFR